MRVVVVNIVRVFILSDKIQKAGGPFRWEEVSEKSKLLQTGGRQKHPEDVCPVVFPSPVQSSLLRRSKLW